MQHLAANHNLVSPGEMKELGRLRAAFMREKCEEVVFCPKPRRSGLVMHQIPEFSKQTRRHRNHPPEHNNSEAGVEILDIFLSKSGCTDALSFGCSPPYFNGSPPNRADNPLIHDVKFNHQSDVKFLHQRVQSSPSTLRNLSRLEGLLLVLMLLFGSRVLIVQAGTQGVASRHWHDPGTNISPICSAIYAKRD